MKKFDLKDFNENPFQKIGKQWMLVGASKDGKSNVMTASWGGLGIMWGKEVAYVFVRESRYTKEFIDGSDELTLSFFSEEHREMLGYMGKTSGRNEDKIAKQNLHMSNEFEVPVFEEAEMTLVCRKLYAQEMKEECFVDKSCVEKWYGDNDYHTMYVVEIKEAWVSN